MERQGVTPKVIALEDMPAAPEVQRHLRTLTGASTVPRVFVGGEFVGGADDLEKMEASEEIGDVLRLA